ncbi:diaminopimelate decarboxylase family protein [Sinorhizobium fredii]|nr:alanine racemase [Sinorhizobium fredii]
MNILRQVSLPTPCLVYGEARLRANIAHYSLNGAAKIRYAVKACSLRPVLQTIAACGAGADCQSIMEVALAKKAGIRCSEISVSSPRLRVNELEWLVEQGIRIIADSTSQLHLIERIVRDGRAPPDWTFGVRLSLGIEATTRFHSKLGMALDTICEACGQLSAASLARLVEIHHHGTARMVSAADASRISRSFGDQVGEIERRLRIRFPFLNLGGGLDSPSMINAAGEHTTRLLHAMHQAIAQVLDLQDRNLVMEPGRALVKDAAVGLTSVCNVKELYGRNLAIVDLSTNVLVPLPLAEFFVGSPGNQASRNLMYDVVDGTCSPAGVIARDVILPKLAAGDRLFIYQAGAYTWSLAEPFYDHYPSVFWLSGADYLAPVFRTADSKQLVAKLNGFPD